MHVDMTGHVCGYKLTRCLG